MKYFSMSLSSSLFLFAVLISGFQLYFYRDKYVRLFVYFLETKLCIFFVYLLLIYILYILK